MKIAARGLFLLCTALLLTACITQTPVGFGVTDSDGLPTPIPTEYLATAIELTVAASRPTEAPSATPTASPTATPTPTASATPTERPTPTITPTPTNTPVPLIPLADIEIRVPGSLSRVVSPIPLRAALVPGAGGKVTIELLGEDGRVLTRQIVTLNENLGRKAGLAIDLAFEIPGVSELGRLQVSITDQFGRPQALSSVDLILLSSGPADFNVVTDLLTPLVIKEPQPGALIQGGTLIVSGFGRPTTSQPFLAELITQEGKIVGMRLFDVEEASDEAPNQHRPFLVEVPYTVTEPTWVRLIIRERGERIPGTIFLTSLELLISP